MAAPVPTRFDYDEDRRAVIVSWSDGPIHRIPFSALRAACPCAVCRGEPGSRGRFATRPELAPGEDELVDLLPVGSYGITPVWADGHQTGIHTYAQLRRLGEAAQLDRTPREPSGGDGAPG